MRNFLLARAAKFILRERNGNLYTDNRLQCMEAFGCILQNQCVNEFSYQVYPLPFLTIYTPKSHFTSSLVFHIAPQQQMSPYAILLGTWFIWNTQLVEPV